MEVEVGEKGEMLWKKLSEGDTVQFFILSDVSENIRRYAEEYYGNGVDDLANGWEEVVQKAEYALIEYYLGGDREVWERIRTVCIGKSYIIFQYPIGHIDMCSYLKDTFNELAQKFEWATAFSHHIPEEYIPIYGDADTQSSFQLSST